MSKIKDVDQGYVAKRREKELPIAASAPMLLEMAEETAPILTKVKRPKRILKSKGRR